MSYAVIHHTSPLTIGPACFDSLCLAMEYRARHGGELYYWNYDASTGAGAWELY